GPNHKIAREWNKEHSHRQNHLHQPKFTSGGINNVNISRITNSGTFVSGLSKKIIPKRSQEEDNAESVEIIDDSKNDTESIDIKHGEEEIRRLSLDECIPSPLQCLLEAIEIKEQKEINKSGGLETSSNNDYHVKEEYGEDNGDYNDYDEIEDYNNIDKDKLANYYEEMNHHDATKLEEISRVIVHNDESLNMNGFKEKNLGHLLYNPKEILPPLEFKENGLMEIWIQAKHLTWDNTKVKEHFVWGTDIYCDDSDVVATLIHSGLFVPLEYDKSKVVQNQPNYDLHVTIRAYPKLLYYKGTKRNNYKSRCWGDHHGVSYKIEKVEKIQIGEAICRSKGGKGTKERMKNFLVKRKKAFNVSNNQNAILFLFNNEHDPCYKYSPELMSDSKYIINRLYSEVLYLENDDERYEVSYNEKQSKYRFSIVSPSVYLGDRNKSNLKHPLSSDKLDEIIRDDLDFHELSWNIVGVVVADKQNQQHSLLCIINRIFWYSKSQD
ncbi:4427_t:CDS:2, partial [Entrophospora sp. SA101]